MKKQELLKQVAEETGLSVKKVGEVYDTIIDMVKEMLKGGESVRLGHVGILKPVNRAARKARNPQTGEEIDVPAHKSVKFKISSKFKDEINGVD